MPDDGRSESGSSSGSEDLETTGLIATRTKRVTAGNNYATLLANLDDEDVQKQLLAEDEEDVGDYEGSDEDDEVLESSSDDEDAGPPQSGAAEELEGEKALKKQERVEARKKRTARDARLKLPTWQGRKRVKIADDVKANDDEDVSTPTTDHQQRPKKKSERSNWLPTPSDAPIRQSGRALAVANREIVHANLKQSAERSEKQRRVMKAAAVRDGSKRRMEGMSQEDRMKKCERIEKETAREFGRWEREEAERQRIRDEALAAKRRRAIEGPVYRWWSGSAMWEGERMKVGRVGGGRKEVEEVKVDEKEVNAVGHSKQQGQSSESVPATTDTTTSAHDTPSQSVSNGQQAPVPQAEPDARSTTTAVVSQDSPNQNSWLHGIQEYAAQSTDTSATGSPQPVQPHHNVPLPPQSTPQQQQAPLLNSYPIWPPGSTHHNTPRPVNPHPTIPPPPLLREQAQRTLLTLQGLPSLETTTTQKRIPKSKQPDPSTKVLELDPLKSILLSSAYPSFNAEEQRYLLAKPKKSYYKPVSSYSTTNSPANNNDTVPSALPAPPAKLRCAITSWPARFRDPRTGLAYADLHQYKVIQRVVAGGCQWSGLLGAWVGTSYGVMGRPARGVPEGFGAVGGIKKEGTV